MKQLMHFRCMVWILLGLGIISGINSLNLIELDSINLANNTEISSDFIENLSMLKETLYRFDVLLNYLEKNYLFINLDGLSGIRMTEGPLIKIISRFQSTNIDENLLSSLNVLLSRLSDLSDITLRSVEIKTPDYLNMFRRLVDSPFIMEQNNDVKYHLIPLNISKNYSLRSMVELKDIPSDDCLSSMLQGNCNMSATCFI